MECAYYFASWNGIVFNSQPEAYYECKLRRMVAYVIPTRRVTGG